MTRILVTGSRDWVDRQVVADAISTQLPIETRADGSTYIQFLAHTLVHGAARGLDQIAAHIAAAWGMQVEGYPADWKSDGKAAGPIRNSRMVSLGADVRIAFPLGVSRGTRDCMAKAEAASIRVINYGDEGSS